MGHLIVLAAAAMLAGPPTDLTVQGRLTNAGGAVVDGPYNLTMGLYAKESGGAPLWSKVLVDVPVSSGVFNATLKGVSADILTNNSAIWLGVKVSTNAELQRTQLAANPYARVAERAVDLQCSGCITPAHTNFLGGCKSGETIVYDGAKWGCGKAGETYSAGAGLSLSGSNKFTVNFAGNGSAVKAARSDHHHDSSYVKKNAADMSYTAIKQVDNKAESTYTVSLSRYHMQLSYTAYYKATKKVPQDILEEYCSDEDGCQVIISMRNFQSSTNLGHLASYTFRFFYDASTLRWRVSDGGPAAGSQGRDNNGITNHVINAYSACYFTDAVYIGGTSQGDNEKGMHLLYYTSYQNNKKKLCELTLID